MANFILYKINFIVKKNKDYKVLKKNVTIVFQKRRDTLNLKEIQHGLLLLLLMMKTSIFETPIE